MYPFLNPVPSDTQIEGVVPRKQLPRPPKGFDWFLADLKIPYKRKYIKEVPIVKYFYVWERVPYSIARGRKYKIGYRKVKGKRKRIYFVRSREYYVDYVRKVFYKTVYRKKKWWILRRRLKPPKLENWVMADDYYIEVLEKYGLKPDDVEKEEEIPFPFIETISKFNYQYKKLPVINTYNLVFMYILVHVPKTSPKTRADKYLFYNVSTDLGGDYKLMQIIKDFIPKILDSIKAKHKRWSKHGRHISLVEFVCFTAVTKRALMEGRS